jgi:hypothetical protein
MKLRHQKSLLKKAEQLGMSIGMASAKLKKAILFNLVQAANRDICYHCHIKISSIDEFSIEHMTPWLDSKDPKELYFDLSNIAFSHIKCNIAAARRPSKITSPDGMKWCWDCKQHKPLGDFPLHAHRNRECTACNTAFRTEYRTRTNKR